jgi:transposase
MGFSFQKPIRKAYQQDPEAVKKWLEEDYPEIRKEASASRASIYFADEAGIRSDHQAGQTWGKRGHTPVIRTTGARHRINAISAISRQGALRYMVFSGNLDANKFVEFLKRVMHKRRRPVTLILDGSSVHKSKSVKTYVDSLKGKLKLYFLPPYSPDLNPDELVWNHLKNHGVNRSKIEDKASFQKMVRAHLRSLLNKPEKIAGFFFKDSTKYAA